MRLAQVAPLVLLLVSSCRTLFIGSDRSSRLMLPRGSSRSPSPTEGSSGPHHQPSSGLLSDNLAQGIKKSASSSSRASGTTQTHSVHLSQSTGVHPIQARPGPPATVSQIDAKTFTSKRLGLLGASLQKPAAKVVSAQKTAKGNKKPAAGLSLEQSAEGATKPSRKRIRPASMSPPRKAEKKPHVPWWQQAGGLPLRSKGTSPRLEEGRKWREQQRLRKATKNSPDISEHPQGHQHPKGGGPGSPGAGSHAVSKRTSRAAEWRHKFGQPMN